MSEFVVHVGPHKTGSTYIQRRLAAAHSGLQRQGVAVPTDWQDSDGNPSHTGLISRLAHDRIHELERQFSSWQTGGYKQVVISTEALMNVSEDALKTLRELIGANTCTIVYYVRAWPELLASVWNELVVHGHLTTMPETLAETLRSPYSSNCVNVSIDIQRFVRVFGAQNIKIVSYNSVLRAKLDLFDHFVNSFLPGAEIPHSAGEIANASFSPEEAELVRILNYLHQKAGNPRNAHIAMSYRSRPSASNPLPILDMIRPFVRIFEVSDEAEPMATIVRECSERFRSMVVLPAPADLLYQVGTTNLRYCSTEFALQPGFLPALEQFRAELLGEKRQAPSLLGRLFGKR